MESIVRDSIMKHLIDNKLISTEQHGFVKNKSCVTNLLETLDLITQALEDGFPIDIIFLDFAKAFDSVPHERLCSKLSAYGINGELLNWCKGFLSNRTQRVVLGKYVSDWKAVLSGVPQGSVLGPLLFVIFINDLVFNKTNKCKLYADDTKVISIIKSQDDISNLQDDLDKMVEWSDKWLVKFNNDKCKVMHIGGNNPNAEYTMMKQLNNKENCCCNLESVHEKGY